MKGYKYISVILFLVLCFPLVAHASVIKGKVTDAKGEPLPFATVYIQGTTNGTTTNADAQYQLMLAAGTYKVLCQYMGYKQTVFNVTIKDNETVTHDFSLQEQKLEMKTVVIKANSEDPAYAIIRKAIKRRKFHLEQVRSFQSAIYLKGVMRSRSLPDNLFGLKINDQDRGEIGKGIGADSNGRGVLYLCEEEADYYSKGDKERTIIRSVRESGNPGGFGLSRMPQIITFYENNVSPIDEVSPRGFVSPISDNAIHYYKYKYEGEFREGGKTINKIKVTPRREFEPLLTGTIYIVEDDWAIYSLDLLATTKSNLELLDTLRFQQAHLELKKDTWVIKSQVLYPTLKILGFDISGYFATVYEKQKVNETVPDSLFKSKIESSYDKTANKKDTSYWTENRPIPLEQDEVKDYKIKDSTLAVKVDRAKLDSLRRRGNRFHFSGLIMGGVHYATKEYMHRFSTNSLLNFDLVNFNSVEGVNVSPKLYWRYRVDTGRILAGNIAARYGFNNTHFNLFGRFGYTHNDRGWRGRYWNAGVAGGKYVYQYNPNSAVTPIYNTVLNLLSGYNYLKLYERMSGMLAFNKNYGNGLQWSASASFERRLPLANTTNFSWSKSSESRLTNNVPSALKWMKWEDHKAALVNLYVSYRPGYTYVQYPDYKMPQGSELPLFSLQYQKGIPGVFNSKSDFDKWRFSIEDDMPLKLMGSLSYKIAAGGFLNKNYVSIPDMMHLADNQLVLAAPYMKSFQLAPYYKYSNVQKLYGEVHLEYYLKGLLTNKIPLLRQAKWYLVAGTNTFYAGQKTYYTEAFAGIDNLGYRWYRFLRVDVVQSWDNTGRQMTGIRIGINPNALGGGLQISSGNGEEM